MRLQKSKDTALSFFGSLCNGSTSGSGPLSLGSNPSDPVVRRAPTVLAIGAFFLEGIFGKDGLSLRGEL